MTDNLLLNRAASPKIIKVLALVLAVQGLPFLNPESAQAQSARQAVDTFYADGYGYCDAVKVASVWQTDIGNAKVIIGQKVINGLRHLIDADIAGTNGRVRCAWPETGLSYADAETLANIWQVQPHEAKTKAEYYVSQMGTKKFRDWIGIGIRG